MQFFTKNNVLVRFRLSGAFGRYKIWSEELQEAHELHSVDPSELIFIWINKS